MTRKDGGTAYPGFSKLEAYALAAMQSIIGFTQTAKDARELRGPEVQLRVAEMAFDIAEAMLQEHAHRTGTQ